MSTRDELTRQAEKSLRQGRVDEAIAHYQELAYLAPVDWGLVKQLADLLERAGQREGAAQQFARWADHLATEGFHSKAAALYKKVLKLDASHEHALWHLGEVSLELKLRADAKVAFQRVADIRQRRGDAAGAAAARERLAQLEATPAPVSAAPTMPPAYAPVVPAIVPAPQVPAAPSPSGVSLPSWLRAPEPEPIRAEVPAPVPIAAPPPPPPETPEARLSRLRTEAEQADAQGAADTDARWQAVLEADPEDVAVRLRLVQAAIDRGDLESASRLALALDAADDAVLVVLVDLAARRAQPDAVERLIAGRVHAGALPDHVLAPVTLLADRHPDAARAALSAAVAAWTAMGQPGHAVAALEHAEGRGLLTTALHLQWVEICVDAGVPDLSRAQRALARAYLGERRVAEARAVAEDVFVREAGAEPSRGLLLDILDRQGVADPHRVLVDLLIPASDILAEGDDPAADPSLAPDSDAQDPFAPPASDAAAPEMMIAGGAFAERFLASLEARSGAVVDGLGRGAPVPPVVSPVIPVADVRPPLAPVASPPAAARVPTPVQAPVEPTPRPAFNWADLLGRDVGDSVSSAPDPAPAPLPVAVPEAPAVSPPAPAPAVVAPPPLPPSVAEEPVPAIDGPVAPAPDAPAVPGSAPAPSLGDLREQPMLVDDAPLQPSFSIPRGWLSDAASTTDEPVRQRAPEDDFFFADDATPARWAPPAARGVGLGAGVPMTPAAADTDVPPPAPSIDLPAVGETPAPPVDVLPDVDPEPMPAEAAGSAEGMPAALDADPAPAEIEAVDEPEDVADEPAPVVEEEVDLTQLLEELKQWDPVLPEPRVRQRTEGAEDSLAGLPLDYPTIAPTLDLPADPVSSDVAPDTASAPQADIVEAPGFREEAALAEELPVPPVTPGAGSQELDAVFADMQRHSDGYAVAEQQLAAGRVFLAAGLASEAARAFERASVEPRSRFAGALALAELHKSRGQLLEAVSWYEHATAAAVPDAAVKRPVLYDLAESLEALGETDRAVGVLLDLLSQVEDYRDARARLDRLLRVDAGG